MSEWYYADEGEQHGPLSASQIQNLVASGRLTVEHLVWCDGMDDWQPAGKIDALRPPAKKSKQTPGPKDVPRKADKPAPRKAGADTASGEDEAAGAGIGDLPVTLAAPAKKQPRKVRRPGSEPAETDEPANAGPADTRPIDAGPTDAASDRFQFGTPGQFATDSLAEEQATDEPESDESLDSSADDSEADEGSLADEPPQAARQPAARRRRPPPSLFPESLAGSYAGPPAAAPRPELGKLALAVQFLAWLCCAVAVSGGIGWFALREPGESSSDPALILLAMIGAALALAHATHRMAEALSRLLRG